MTDVSVIGLGRMGGAIARALRANGRTVTVWNRTPAAIDPLIEHGAERAASPAEAIASSPITFVVVLDYAASYEVLGNPGVSEAVSGRTIVQLTSGTPAEARAMSTWADQRDASYVDGYPACFETVIGTPQAVLLYAGADGAIDPVRPHLEALGEAIFAGSDVGSSNAILMANVAFYHAALLGFLQGAAVAGAVGVAGETFTELMLKFVPTLAEAIGEMGRGFAGQKPLSDRRAAISNNAAVARSLLETCRDLGVSPDLPATSERYFAAAVERGLVGQDVAAMLPLFLDSSAGSGD